VQTSSEELNLLARRVVELDFDEIEKWCEARGGRLPDKSLFPRTGFIIDGIAAGFVYFTDSAVAIIDCYLSNPKTDPKTRSDALNEITSSLIKSAQFHKCSVIKCDTKLEAIKKRATDFGFKSVGTYESFILEL
jgi:hypothetical protein